LQVKPQVLLLHEGDAFATFVVHTWVQLPQCCALEVTSVHVLPHERPQAPADVQHAVQLNPLQGHDVATHDVVDVSPPESMAVLPESSPVPGASAFAESSPESRAESSPESVPVGLVESSPAGEVESSPDEYVESVVVEASSEVGFGEVDPPSSPNPLVSRT
jgi:hypothetical protein